MKRFPVKGKGVMDARQKIIQKKRKQVVDARDILANMAKKQDARSKLLKLREGKTNGNVQVIGKSILRKTGPDGKISLVTSKAKQTTRDINLAIKQQLGLISPVRSPKKVVRRPAVAPKPISPTMIRKTIYNDVEYAYERLARGYPDADSLYRWVRPDLRTAGPLKRTRNITENRLATYIDLDAVDDEEMPLIPPPRHTISLQGSSRSTNVHSRLDTYPVEPKTHGILAQSTTTKTKVVIPAGHRIVVSNLQPTVTQDDIKVMHFEYQIDFFFSKFGMFQELFEDIGQLLVARLVRPGTAEVIYKNLRDAQKAVDTYHNRQLDGQPMKCLLVNKRPANNPTAPALAPHATSEG